MHMAHNADEELRQWGENIQLRRNALNSSGALRTGDDEAMTQAQLGLLMDPPVHQSTIARWEAGLIEPRRHFKAQLATVLMTDVRMLFPMTRVAS